MSKPSVFIGDKFVSKNGQVCEVVEYINSGKVSEQDIADCPHKYKQRAQTVYFRFVRIT